MTIYIVLLFIILVAGFLFSLNKKLYHSTLMLKLTLLLMVFIISFRGINVGKDTRNYNRFYNEFTNQSIDSLFSSNYYCRYNVERTWAIFNHLIGNLLGDFHFVLLFASSIYLIGVYYLLKDNRKLGVLAIVSFLYSGLFVQAMNLTRQYTAMGICLIGWHLLRKNKKILAIFCLILSFFIHKSAIIFIPFILISTTNRVEFTKRMTLVCVVFTIFGILFYEQIMTVFFSIPIIGWYSKYADTYKNVGIGLSKYIWLFELLITLIIYLYNRKRNLEDSDIVENEIRMQMVIIYFLFNVLSARFLLLSRCGRYFQLATLGIYDDFCHIIRKKFGYYTYVLTVFLLLMILSATFLVSIYSNIEQYDYQFFW